MRLTCTINGEQREVDGLWEGESLLHVLRERLALPGSKNACEQGECGSCSIYLDGELVCSCLVMAGQAEGREIVTVEGLAPGDDELHPIQEAFLEAGAVQCGFCTPGLIVATHDLLARTPDADGARDPRGAGRQPLPLHRLREDPRRREAGGAAMKLVIEGCAIATVDAAGTEHADGHIVIEDGRIVARRRRRERPRRPRIDGRGRLATPGLVNCHHHLYQWATRGLVPAVDPVRVAAGALPRVGARRRRHRARRRARRAGRARALRLQHEHRPPLRLPARGRRPAGDRGRGRARAARALPPVPRQHGPRRSQGGLPPDEVTEDRDAILTACAEAIDRFHDPAPDAMVRVALAPCSPFSVTRS